MQFTPIDWDSGAAKAIMEYLKSLPTGSKSYIPTMKEWRVDKKKAPDALKEVFRLNQEYIQAMNKPDPDDFDANKTNFMERVSKVTITKKTDWGLLRKFHDHGVDAVVIMEHR